KASIVLWWRPDPWQFQQRLNNARRAYFSIALSALSCATLRCLASGPPAGLLRYAAARPIYCRPVPPRRSASHITAADLILDHICPRIGQCWRHSKTGGCETAMKQYADAGIRTLQNALFDHMNSDDLNKLGALTKQKLPSRKGDLVDVITRHLEGDGLQTAWRGLDELQRAAVAEVVHSEETYFPADLFRAKYGQNPVWESKEENRYHRKPSPLCFFFYRQIMPDDLKTRLKTFVPPPAQAKISSPKFPRTVGASTGFSVGAECGAEALLATSVHSVIEGRAAVMELVWC